MVNRIKAQLYRYFRERSAILGLSEIMHVLQLFEIKPLATNMTL